MEFDRCRRERSLQLPQLRSTRFRLLRLGLPVPATKPRCLQQLLGTVGLGPLRNGAAAADPKCPNAIK